MTSCMCNDTGRILMEPKKSILIIHYDLHIPNGGNAVAAWMLEALKKEYDITMLTWKPVDVAAYNRYLGTSLHPTDFKNDIVPFFIRWIIDLIPNDPWHFQRYCVLMRWCKMIRHGYNIIMTASNETDFGIRGIQYMNFPYQNENWLKEQKRSHRKGRLPYWRDWIKTRFRPWRIISGFSFERMKRNLTLVNSHWTGKVYHRVYGVESVTVYPPVPGHFPEVPWEQKKNGFVCIGRIAGDKKLERIIDILTSVRSQYPEVHLHIIGSPVDYDKACYQRVKRKVEENASWVFLNENLSREKLVEMVCRHRYGIHGMPDEHFGIAVAEMVRGGCIVFVPDEGGQVEIVGHDRRLLYHSQDEAVAKILHVLNHPQEQISLHQYLDSRKEMFSTEKFTQRLQDIVSDFLLELKT